MNPEFPYIFLPKQNEETFARAVACEVVQLSNALEWLEEQGQAAGRLPRKMTVFFRLFDIKSFISFGYEI
ncbi:hypothetical protein [Methanolacinia paynteri]|uniref:hypothetical protein n=1 Tax=Methanolacinia paynteri TaxID=230356 RepID=UPI00064F7F14|nr:hypothetical protein [Methanolacinia paynteri]